MMSMAGSPEPTVRPMATSGMMAVMAPARSKPMKNHPAMSAQSSETA